MAVRSGTPDGRKAQIERRDIPRRTAMPPERVLGTSFYDRDTVTVARELLGKVLRVRDGAASRSGILVEVEAYLRDDPANHAYRGPNRRNRSMFQGPGTAYVYTLHGVDCMNVVTRTAEAVLIRAIEPLHNVSLPTNGPGRLCRALGITKERHDGVSVLGPDLTLLDAGFPKPEIGVSARIGVTKASDKPLRFFALGNRYVSR